MSKRPLSVKKIIQVKRKALRKRVWYKATSKLERALLNCLVRTVDVVRNQTLLDLLDNIVTKLTSAMESFIQRAERIGHLLAQRLAKYAFSVGWEDALTWADDPKSIQYIGIVWLNTPPQFRSPLPT